MKAYTATFYLDGDEQKQLEEITALCNKIAPLTMSSNDIFNMIMVTGSKRLIDSKLNGYMAICKANQK